MNLDLVILELNGQRIYLVLRGVHDDPEVSAYSIEEAACPHDILSRAEVTIIEGDTDPHGCMQFLRTIPDPRPRIMHDPEAIWREHFPEAFVANETQAPR